MNSISFFIDLKSILLNVSSITIGASNFEIGIIEKNETISSSKYIKVYL